MVSKIIIKQSVPSQYLFAGGYASFDSGTISGWHYYIQDYMGSNRMVVNGQTGATEQVTHFYPYGGVIGDISTNESLQAYKFEGKVLAAIEKIDNLRREDEPLGEGKDRTFGLDWYDIHARQYDAIGVPGWNKVDDLAGDYTGISPYSYCAGDPVNCIDLDGHEVLPMGDDAFTIIKNTLPKDSHSYLKLNSYGYIDKSLMARYKGNSDNFNRLKTLVDAPMVTIVTTLSETEYISSGEKYTESFDFYEIDFAEFADTDFNTTGNTTGESGNLGVTYIPTKEGESGKSSVLNPNGIHININPQLTQIGAAESFSHEGYGHAYLYITTKDRQRSTHMEGGGSSDELKDLIIKSRKETIKNMQQ